MHFIMRHISLIPLLLTAAALTACGGSFDDRLREEAADYTANHCPQRLDAYTVLDSVAYDASTRTYTSFLSVPDSLAAALRGNADELRAVLTGDLKADVGKKRCKDEKIAFRYVYSCAASKEGVLEVTLTAADYGQ